jgi:HK97 family phage portal protein
LVTNEVYLVATGRPNRVPAELYIESPEFVEVKTDPDGLISRFEVRRKTEDYSSMISEVFYRDPLEYRFFNKDRTAEIWQIKGFNTRKTLRGRSKLSSAVYEIEQYLQAAIHNLSLLENGVRSTGAFTTDEPLTDEQFMRLRDQIYANQAGSENAGKSIILEGGMDYKEMSMSPKDMDFEKLKQSTTEAIFRRYKIPLALVSTDSMAESTMEVSQLMLYDNVVLPLAHRLLAEVTQFLAPRFSMSEDAKVVPFEEDITALQIRRIKEIKNKKETGVHTVDEIRKDMGDEPLPDGKGAVLYIPQNLVPIGEPRPATGTGLQGRDNRQPEGDIDMESDTLTDDERMKTTRVGFISILKQQVDIKGERIFTDAEIYKFADEEGL